MILESAASATVEGLIGFFFSKVNSQKTGGLDEEGRLLLSALLSTQTEQSKRLDLLDSLIRQHAAAPAVALGLSPAERRSLMRETAATLTALVGLGYSSIDVQHQEIFAVHAGQIWHRWWWLESGWSDWHQFHNLPDGALVASVTAGYHAPGYQDLFAVSVDGRLFHTWYDGPAQTWADWEPLQGP